MCAARYHTISLFDDGDDDNEDRRAEHEEATKTPALFDFAPKGPDKSSWDDSIRVEYISPERAKHAIPLFVSRFTA
jgi:hypothetical protein